MPDIIKENLLLILESIDLIEERFSKIKSEDDFVNNQYGLTILDAISMRLQFIGECLKRIEKIDLHFFDCHPEIEWDKIINLRDFISHHYDMLDHQIIYNICKIHIPKLQQTIKKISEVK